MFKKNDKAVLTITDLSEKGEGIGKADGFVFFVKDTIPGDVAEVVITKLKKTYGYARMLRILEPSPDRVEAPCPVARQCGGCQLQMMRYDRQLEWKERRVQDVLERIGGFPVRREDEEGDPNAVLLKPIRPSQPFRYRHKAVIPVGKDRAGRPVAGFYAGRTHTIIPCGDCLIGDERNGAVIREVLSWMKEERIPAYDERSGTGLIRHVFLRASRETGDIQLCLIVNGRKVPASEKLRRRLEERHIPVCGAGFSSQTDKGNRIWGGPVRMLWGSEYLTDRLVSKKYGVSVQYQISPQSFFQVAPAVAEQIYETVLDCAQLTGTETVFDLYCGTGSIALFTARMAGKVIGVEVVPDAVRDARRNAAHEGIRNVRFLEGMAEEVVPELIRGGLDPDIPAGLQADVVIVDPPRKGCAPKLLQTILNMRPDRIVYVSCDPSTLARDLKILAEGQYRVEYVQPFDQFAMSVHVESVVLMSRVGAKQ